MYYRYYEKLVKERLKRGMRDEVREGIGSYIRRERLKQGLKQINVCQGVCSVSYYSRIERNKIKPKIKHIREFFLRLNQSIPHDLFFDRQREKKILDQYYHYLAYEKFDEMKMMVDKEKNYPLLYHIMTLLLVTAQRKVDEARETLKIMYKYRDTLSDLELLSLLYGTAYFYFLKEEYEYSKQYLELCFDIHVEQDILMGYIHYLYAKVMSRLRQSFTALRHIEVAMDLFLRQCVGYFTIRGQLFTAIEIAKHSPYQAIIQFKRLLESDEVKSRQKYFILSKFWLSFTYMRLNEYERSIELFQELRPAIKDYPFIGIVYIHLLYLCGDKTEAKALMKEIKKERIRSSRLRHMLIYMQSLMADHSEERTIELLENKLIPYAVKEKDSYLEWEWRLMAIKLLEASQLYKEATFHYKALLGKINGLSII